MSRMTDEIQRAKIKFLKFHEALIRLDKTSMVSMREEAKIKSPKRVLIQLRLDLNSCRKL